MQGKRLACVVLNYNDAPTCIKLLERIKDYKNIDEIILVDNASSVSSLKSLRSYVQGKEKISFIENKVNSGYSSGNNLGVRYSVKEKKCAYALIANPDVYFEDKTVGKLKKALENNGRLACVSPLMLMPKSKEVDCLNFIPAFPLRPWAYDILEILPLCRRIFNPVLNYGKSFYKKREEGSLKKVGAVAGSLLLLDTEKFLEVNAYDENIFLYQEEAVLGFKLRRKAYDTAVLTDEFYIHEHSVSISKSYKKTLERQALREESLMYYYKKYLKISKIQECMTRIAFLIVRSEIFIYEALCTLKDCLWKR